MSTEEKDQEIIDNELNQHETDETLSEVNQEEEYDFVDYQKVAQENEALKNELQQKEDLLLRRAAEFDNYRKRTQKERIQLFEDSKLKALEAFLPIFDDLERTLDSVKDDEESPFIKGVELIRSKFQNILDQHGLERIDETGVPFDVNIHDALIRQPAPDESLESDMVIQILESGYKVGEKVIRHAKVIVSE
jgi:molecular chaperone GrpE